MKALAPYIQHFLEAFRGSQANAERPLRPYDGRVFRFMSLDATELRKYQKDSIIVWPTFSSCTYDEDGMKKTMISATANATFEVRIYGAAEAASDRPDLFYLPCVIEDHVHSCFTYEKEVVMPPFCRFRVVNVNKSNGWLSTQTRIFLETTQFPSVWQSINAGQTDDFVMWAKQNEDLLSMTGNDVSIVNEIAKATAQAVKGTHARCSAHDCSSHRHVGSLC